MPEIKNTFTQGKMNKDLDERIVPNGQYRDAMNIQVSTSEGSDVGTVQNILGNIRIDDKVGGSWKCIGTIADEKNDRLFWFIHASTRDAILEYSLKNNAVSIVLIDTNDILGFTDNVITGINIIDDLLFWTDNNSEPKKINIDRCKKGSTDFQTHTKLVVNDTQNIYPITLKTNSIGQDDDDVIFERVPHIVRVGVGYHLVSINGIELEDPIEIDAINFTDSTITLVSNLTIWTDDDEFVFARYID